MKTIFITDKYFLIPLVSWFSKTDKEVAIEIDDIIFNFLIKLYYYSDCNVGNCILVDWGQ